MNITDSQKIKNAGTSQNPDVLRKLAKSSNKSVLRALVLNPNTPADVLESFAPHKKLYFYIAAHPNTPASILDELGKPEHHQFIREAVALNPSTSTKTLDDMVNNSHEQRILKCIALNPNVSENALISLQARTFWSEDGGLSACLAFNSSSHYVYGDAFIRRENSARLVAEHLNEMWNTNPGLRRHIVKPNLDATEEDVIISLSDTFNPPKPQNDRTQRQVVLNSPGAKTREQTQSKTNEW